MQKATPGGTRPQDAGNHAFSFWREAHHRRDRNIVGVSHGGRAHTPVPSCSLPLLQAFCSRGHAAVPESAVTGAEHETFFMGAFCPAGGTAQTGTSLPLRTPLRFCRLWNVSIMTHGNGSAGMVRPSGTAGRANVQTAAGPCGAPAFRNGGFCGKFLRGRGVFCSIDSVRGVFYRCKRLLPSEGKGAFRASRACAGLFPWQSGVVAACGRNLFRASCGAGKNTGLVRPVRRRKVFL